ncbi:MAG TPA: glycoside hydrolase domain-containing protein [Bacillus sp. (in: firmicutes)]|uniref:glycoside hydrolase domain-containing protein n=1 Tax=Bacillus litorisediminis TaxID=2922713 RepID=UPI001FAFAC02|nr:glycoside hydrolase domain-containing protein [Bacillus litorisediminis]HWO74694.1 glycoside hydrolase domain-containing protein [Bacillus sp. (in: firmicutes)]
MRRVIDNFLCLIVPMILYMGLIFLSLEYPQEKENSQSPGHEQPVTQEPQPSNPESHPSNPDPQPDDQDQPANSEPKPSTPDVVWSVDSASLTTENLLACVREHVGQPKVWGRYLEDKDDVSYGLKKEEVQLLLSEGISILLIYNHFNDARGYENGKNEAAGAVKLAKNLGVPPGVALFADIEPGYPVDEAFIRGWYDGLSASDYHPGIYGIFAPDRQLTSAFEKASKANPAIKSETVIWSAFPQVGITTEQEAPAFQGEAPEGSLLLGWQYGIEAQSCNIDTNLFKEGLLTYLWNK